MLKSASIFKCKWRFLSLLAAIATCNVVYAAEGMAGRPKAVRLELGASAAFTRNGVLLAVAKQGEHVLLYRSADEGRSWSAPVVVNAQPEPISADGENRPKIAYTQDGAVLVSWTRPLGKPFSAAIRLARSEDGLHFSAPITVHHDSAEITHRFESMIVADDGRVVLAWIDKRDLELAKVEKRPYRGAAIYAATSHDGGRSFQPEIKVADHSCECCRLATALDKDGSPLFMWRQVFVPNERDHAIARILPDGTPTGFQRATFDRWKVDGCPHHGPALAVDSDGVRHAVWFNQKNGEGRVFYGRLSKEGGQAGVAAQRLVGGERAERADLAIAGKHIAIVWKEFDGERTRLFSELSEDGGASFKTSVLAASNGANDQPRALRRGDQLYVFWRSEQEGMRIFRVE
ncbi:MAG: hypothetical protein QG584_2093 [Pseudomonadota bacterium]|nr:hypothetical protein [Pseudomonadota bacterium]